MTGVALGDRRTTSAFKRAHVSFEEGSDALAELSHRNIIKTESSGHFLLDKRSDSKLAKRALFGNPFLRFWFGFVSPIYKGIKSGDYQEFHNKFQSKKAEFFDFVFEELAHVFLRNEFKQDSFKIIKRYWDENVYIPILAKTHSDKTVVGVCKYKDKKVKKSDLNSFYKDLETIRVCADIVVIFSKNGFSTELKSQKSETLRLYTSKHFKKLLL